MDTVYLGMELRSPLVASAGPLTQNVDEVKRLADTGVGALVMHSMFAEKLLRDAAADAAMEDSYAELSAEATSVFPEPLQDVDPANHYLNLVQRSVAAVDIPIIASLNAAHTGTWVSYAQQLADAGASAIECNIYFVPGNATLTGAEVELRHLQIVEAVTGAVDVPVAVKLSPHFSSVGNFALRLIDAGADGLVLFNRFLQPRMDIKTLSVEPGVTLSSSEESHLPRAWIATLRNRTAASLAAPSGVETAADVIAYLLAGADVVMTTSALVRHGISYAETLLSGVEEWRARRGFASIADMRGTLALPSETDGDVAARNDYLAALEKAQITYGSTVG